MMRDMYDRLVLLEKYIARFYKSIHQVHKASPASQRLEKVRGVGPLIATAVIAAGCSATFFSNSRQFAAWLSLIPRPSLVKRQGPLFGIPERENGYLRMPLVHGARSIVQQAPKHQNTRMLSPYRNLFPVRWGNKHRRREAGQ